MTDRDGLLAAILTRPADDTPRLVYADFLDDHGEPELAAATRAMVAASILRHKDAIREVVQDPVLRYAAILDATPRGRGLLEFARCSVRVNTFYGEVTDAVQAEFNWEYDTLRKRWRDWLPPTVTLLTRRADREAFNKDYGPPAITFPTRRRHPREYNSPVMSVCFTYGFPEWVECDDVDWERAGLDLTRAFPWVGRDTRWC